MLIFIKLRRCNYYACYPDREIVGILKKSGIVNHFKGDTRSSEGGSKSVKKLLLLFDQI